MKTRRVMLSRSGAKAKNLALPATEHEILRPEFIPSRNSGQALSGGEGASE